MDWLRRLSWAFVAGCVGVIVFYIGLRLALATGIMSPPEQALAVITSKAFLYQKITWGGIWGFLFAAPVLARMWWLRGLIVGLLATLAALFIFQPTLPPLPLIVVAAVLNMVFWGLSAAFWHDKVMLREQ